MGKRKILVYGLLVVILLTTLLSVFSNASVTYAQKAGYLFTDDFETTSFWSSGRTASSTAFSGNYVVKGSSNSSYIYSNKLSLELNTTYTFGFWYRNPAASSTDKVAVFYKNTSGRYSSIKSVTLEQTEDWKYCSFEFKHSRYSDFYFGVQGTDVEIDSVAVPYTYSTCGNLIENGSFEKGELSWNTIEENFADFSGNATDGVACAVLNGEGGIYCDFDTVPFAEYKLSFKYKGNTSGAGWALSRVRNGLSVTDFITDKTALASCDSWTTVTFSFNAGNRERNRFVLQSSPTDDFCIDAVSVTPNEDKNLIINGGFESGVSDWKTTGNTLAVSDNANSGEAALIQPSAIYRKVWQAVDVKPDTEYMLSFCYKGTSWLKWVVCDAADDSQADYAPNTDSGYIIGSSAAVKDSVNWNNVTVTFNSGNYERIAFAIQSASGSSDLLFDDISITEINVADQTDGYFDSFGNKTPYNDYPYITDDKNNLFGDYSFEKSDDSAWNTDSFINGNGTLVDDGENGKVYKFTAGDSEAVNSITFNVEPNTDYWLTLKIKNPPLSAENTYNFTYGLANVDTGEFLLGKEPDTEQYREFTSKSQLTIVAMDDEWHIISAKYHTVDENKLMFAVKGKNTVGYFDDVYFFKDSDRKHYITEAEKLSDVSITDSSPTQLYYGTDGKNLFSNSDFSDGDNYWNTAGDGNVLFGTKLSVTDSGSDKYGKSLNYCNSSKYPNRNYYIKWVDVKPNTEYTFAAKCRIVRCVNDRYVAPVSLGDKVYTNSHTYKGGSFGILSGYKFDSELTENQLLPTTVLEYKFSSANYSNSDWKDVAVSFNTNDRNRVGFMIYDGGGGALIDDIRLFETAYATSKAPAYKPDAPKIEWISYDKASVKNTDGAMYGISTDNNEFGWQSENLFVGLKSDTQYYFSIKYAETDNSLESPQSESVIAKTYKKGDITKDSKISLKDLVRLKRNILEHSADYLSDLSGDGKISADDLVILRKILLN